MGRLLDIIDAIEAEEQRKKANMMGDDLQKLVDRVKESKMSNNQMTREKAEKIVRKNNWDMGNRKLEYSLVNILEALGLIKFKEEEKADDSVPSPSSIISD